MDHEHLADKSSPSTLNYEPSTSANWSPWSDSHRRIRVYETRPVAAEAQRRSHLRFLIYDLRFDGRASCTAIEVKSSIGDRRENGALTWICTTNFRLRRAACRTNYT